MSTMTPWPLLMKPVMTTLARTLQSRGILDSPCRVKTSILSVTLPFLMVNCLRTVQGTLEFLLIMISLTNFFPSWLTERIPRLWAVTSAICMALRPVALLQ